MLKVWALPGQEGGESGNASLWAASVTKSKRDPFEGVVGGKALSPLADAAPGRHLAWRDERRLTSDTT